MEATAWLGDRAQALEHDYFRHKELELVEVLRTKGRVEQGRRTLTERLDAANDALRTGLQDAGFTSDSLAVLHLVPLIQMAWVDGRVDPGERALLFALAAARGVDAQTPAYWQLAEWLETQPDDRVFETIDTLLATTLALRPSATRVSAPDTVLDWTTTIADATGEMLGMIPTSNAERVCIERLTKRVAHAAQARSG